MKVFEIVEEYITREPVIKGKRLPTFYPSAASCYMEDESGNLTGEVAGSCLRSQWYRCAGYQESNPPTAYNEYIFAAGNMWEDWLNRILKESNRWLGNSIRFAIEDLYISGEIDILAKDDNGRPVIIENKTYNASNYNAKAEICGLSGRRPTPKYSNAMQAALYLMFFSKPENGGVEKVLLTYMDRSCSGPEAQRQFDITLNKRNDKTYIHIDCEDVKGTRYSYDLPGVTMEGIVARYQELMKSLQDSLETPPRADFMHVYPPEVVQQKHASGEITKTKYEKWLSNPDKYPIGYFMCQSYCNYRSLCKSHKDISGET